MASQSSFSAKPTAAFVGASWAVLLLGVLSFGVGLWNATMTKSEKGFYAAVLVLGVFAAVSLQKSVRDRVEGLPVGVVPGAVVVGGRAGGGDAGGRPVE